MVTKYNGSLIDLLKVNKLALVNSSYVFVQDNISEYILNSSKFLNWDLIEKSNGKFEIELGSRNLIFNNIVYYTDDLSPIGFTNLNQEIDTSLLTINTLEIKLDLLVINKEFYLDLGVISYLGHISNNLEAHKYLFDIPTLDKPLKRSDILTTTLKDSIFSEGICELTKDVKLTRYSGSLYKSLDKIISDEFVIPIGDEESLIEIIKVDGVIFLVYLNGTSLKLQNFDSVIELDLNGGILNCIGNNLAIIDNNIHYIQDLISGNLIPYPILNQELLWTKDLVTKEVYFYSIQEGELIPYSEKLKKIISELSSDTLSKDVIGVCTGLIVSYDQSNDTTEFLTYYQSTPFTISGKVRNITAVTKDLLIIDKEFDSPMYSKWIIEFFKNINTNKYERRSILMGRGPRYRAIDLIAKNQITNILNLSPIFISCDGSIFKSIEIDGINKITRL